jgi:hypothetical protein
MEQNKRSAVTNVTANGTYNGQYGMLYKFQVSFANGDVAEYNAKTQNQTKFVVGQEVDYVLTDREYQGTIYYKCKPAEVQQGIPSTETKRSRHGQTHHAYERIKSCGGFGHQW